MMKVEQLSTVIPSLLIILIITITNGVEARSPLQPVCSSSCGDIPKISYPLLLKGDPPSCGDPGYELSCENNRTIFKFYSGKYYVTKISYDKHIIRVVDVNLASGSCNLPSGSLSYDDINADFRYRGILTHTYSKFARCSKNVTDPGYELVPCVSSNGWYVYANISMHYSDFKHVPKSCELIYTVLGDYVNVTNPSYGDIMNILEAGFDLEWSVECRDCLVSGYYCAFTKFDPPILYICDDGKDAGTEYTEAFIIFYLVCTHLLGLFLIARYIFCPIVVIVFLIYKCRTTRKSPDTVTENIQQG